MMKITALLGIFCLLFLFSCQKDGVNPDTVPAKSTTTHTDTTTIANTGVTTIVTPTVPGNNNPATTPATGTTTPSTGTTTTTPVTGTTTTPAASTTTPSSSATTTAPATGNTTTITPATSTTGTTTTKPSSGTATTPATSVGAGATATTAPATSTGSAATTGTTSGTSTTKPSSGTATVTGVTTAPTTKPSTGTTTTPSTGTTATKPASGTTTTTTTKTTPPSTTGDDTKTLQQLLNAGDVTLVAGKAYNITGLSVPHAFNLNGATVNMTKNGGTAIRLTATGASISNGTLNGSWSNTTPGNPSGGQGISMLANNTSVSHVSVSSFSAYGILAGPVNNISITNCQIANTGYIGFFFDAETALTSGGTFSNNIVDRSMVPASTILETGVAIRGSTSNPSITTSNWTISGNTIKMPALPASIEAECMEVRCILNTTISNNTFTNGSIGCSVVEASNMTLSGNKLSGSTQEAIELGNCNTCVAQNNVITGTLGGVGELIDGGTGSNGITITNDVISGTTQECIHTYLNTKNVTITGCTLSAAKGAPAINMQATSNVKIVNTTFNGNSVATEAVLLDTCPGNLSISGGSISNFKTCVIAIYNVKAGLTTDNVTMTGVKVTGVARALSSDVENGAILGSNIVVVN